MRHQPWKTSTVATLDSKKGGYLDVVVSFCGSALPVYQNAPADSADLWVPIECQTHRAEAAPTLANGMKIVLISSGDLTGAACAFRIGVGSQADPEERPGLFELIAQCIASEIQEELGDPPSPGQSLNLAVEDFSTSLSIAMRPEDLTMATRKFCAILEHPEFYLSTETLNKNLQSMESRRRRINREFLSNTDRLMASLSNTEQACHGFKGSFALLKNRDLDSLRSAAIEAVKSRYVPQQITVSLVGQNSLKNLRQSAAQPLVNIPPSKHGSDNSIKTWVPATRDSGTLITAIPRYAEGKAIQFRLPLPQQGALTQRQHNVAGFIGKLLTDGAEGSLAAELEAKGLARDVKVWVSDVAGGPELVVEINPECRGQIEDKLVKEIGTVLYMYLGSLRESRCYEWKLKSSATDGVEPKRIAAQDLAEAVKSWEVADKSLESCFEDLHLKQDEDTVLEILRCLEWMGNAENARMLILDSDWLPSKKGEDSEKAEVVQEQEVLDIDFVKRKFPEDWLTEWKAVVRWADVESKMQLLKRPTFLNDYAVNLLELKNGLRLVLISSPKVDSTVCGVVVEVGGANDPPDYQGLAHLLGTLVLRGSERYPEESSWHDFTGKHGGYSAFGTSKAHTCFLAKVTSQNSEELVDRLADALKNPLLTPNSIAKDLLRIDTLHKDIMTADSRRLQRVFQHCGNPENPEYGFTNGTREQLEHLAEWNNDEKAAQNALREKLQNFFREQYSSNLMTVVLMGKQPMQQMEAAVVEKFTEIPNKQRKPLQGNPQWNKSNALFRPGQELGQIITAAPVQSTTRRSASLNWAMNCQFRKLGKSPLSYVMDFLNSKFEGSVSSVLRNKGIASDFGAFQKKSGFGQTLIQLKFIPRDDVELTTDLLGYVGSLICGSVRLLLEADYPDWLLEETSQLNHSRWMFQRGPSDNYTVMSWHDLREPLADVVGPPKRRRKGEVMAELENFKDTNNLIIRIKDAKFKDELDEIEPLLKVPFKREPIPQSLSEKLHGVFEMEKREFTKFVENEGLKLPTPNPYIAQDLALRHGSESNPLAKKPKVLSSEKVPGLKIYFKPITIGAVPRMALTVRARLPAMLSSTEDQKQLCSQDFPSFWEREKKTLASPTSELKDLSSSTRSLLVGVYLGAIRRALWDDRVRASFADLHYFSGFSKLSGEILFEFGVDGLQDKASNLLTRAVDAFLKGDVSDNHIADMILNFKQDCEAKPKKLPYHKAPRLECSVFSCGDFAEDDLPTVLESITVDTIRKFFRQQNGEVPLWGILGNGSAECVVVGNFTEQEARNLFFSESTAPMWSKLLGDSEAEPGSSKSFVDLNLVKTALADSALSAPSARLIQSSKSNVKGLIFQEPNPENESSAITLSMFRPAFTARSHVFFNTLRTLISSKFFSTLRGANTAGYLHSYPSCTGSHPSYVFHVQTSESSTDLLEKMLRFIKENIYDGETGEVIVRPDEEEFKGLMSAQEEHWTNNFNSVDELKEFYLNDLDERNLDFDSIEQCLNASQTYSREDFLSDVRQLATEFPWIISRIYPKTESAEIQSLKDTSVNLYQVDDHRFLQKLYLSAKDEK